MMVSLNIGGGSRYHPIVRKPHSIYWETGGRLIIRNPWQVTTGWVMHFFKQNTSSS